jgi:hypothetical protein
MCRSIRTLHNYEPAATDQEISAAALQFVRKVSGYREPSKVNQAAFDTAVSEVSATVQNLLNALQTKSAPKHRGRNWHSHLHLVVNKNTGV